MKIRSLDIALTSSCAALYCIGSLATAFIPTGVIIQLRPAVLIPAIFSVLFGPWIGSVGAALGTFIASIIRYGTPLLTIFSGTPANFACFYILGYLTWKLSRKMHWTISYLIANLVAFFTGFLIIAIGLYILALLMVNGVIAGFPWLTKWLNPIVMFMGTLVVGFLPEFSVSYFIGIPLIVAICKVLPQVPFAKLLRTTAEK